MAAHKENQEHKQSIFERFIFIFREEEEELPQEKPTDFLSMARQLRGLKQEEAEETQALEHDVKDWIAGEAIKMLHMTGTALGNRIHSMFTGDSTTNDVE